MRELLSRHVPMLRAEELVTDRPVTFVRARSDGTYIEIFEWRSNDHARRAHENPKVAELWAALEAAAEFVRLADLREAARSFAHFEPIADVPH